MVAPKFRAVALPALLATAAATLAAPAAAQNAAFDLSGPSVTVTVARGAVTLPLAQVPGLAAGDRIAVRMAAPADRGSRYSVVLAFLRGATSPPPADWLFEARPWDPKRATIDAAVPAGAEQAVILLVPETGGAIKAVESALRGRPGAFVRAGQELSQASLDRARLDAYLAAARAQDATGAISPDAAAALARSLAVKVDPACLVRQLAAQAACLAQSGGASVLADAQTSSLAQNLAGAPADVALAVSSTPQASFGYYSPYIGLVRDLARIFGAFQSAQLQFIPALEIHHDGETQLFLNTPPSFRRPQSVLVAPLPAVAPAPPPVIAPAGGDAALCVTRMPLIAGFTGAPLLYATDYARQMRLRVTTADGGTVDLPATADPLRGGYVIDAGSDPTRLVKATGGVLHGLWGFEPFEGPRYALVSPVGAGWRVADRASLVIGRESPLPLEGGAAACLSGATVDRDGERRTVGWSVGGVHAVTLKVPLDDAAPGPVTLLLDSYGQNEPQRLSVRAYSEPSRLSSFTVYAGERTGTLVGTRLDQVSALDLDGVLWRPDVLGRVRSTDRLDMVATSDPAAAPHAGSASAQAKVTLSDGRTAPVRVVVAPAPPAATLVHVSVDRVGTPPRVPIRLADPTTLPAAMRVVFSIRAPQGSHFAATDQVEVAAGDQGASARVPIHLQDADVALADIVPATALGAVGYGPARFRVVKDGTPGGWRPLGTIVRLPTLRAIRCADAGCTLEGDALYLLRATAPAGQPAEAVAVPDGFTGDTIRLPRSPTRRWRLTLRDAPAAEATIGAADQGATG